MAELIAKLLILTAMFSKLSLLAIGGVNSTVPELAQQVVQVRHWMTATQFSQLFALAQSAPGPNLLIVALIGAHYAGVAGGVVAMVAICVPSGILAIAVSGIWNRFRKKRWRRVVQAALLPITAGLLLSAGAVLIGDADRTVLFTLITLVAICVTFATKLHPLWILTTGLLLGLVFA